MSVELLEADPVIYTASRVIVDANDPGGGVDAIAVAGGRVLAAGALAAVRNRFSSAEIVDFPGATIVPGLHDAHIHLAITAIDMLHLDLSTAAVGSLAELVRTVAIEATRTPAGQWVRGSRYDDAKMPEGRTLTRWDLDQAAPNVPVLVLQVAGHWGVVNSAALKLAGINEDSEPPAGGDYGRDASGRLNGILYERGLFDISYPAMSTREAPLLPADTMADKLTGLSRAVNLWHAAGLTSICDAAVGPADLRLFAEAADRDLLTLRTGALLTAENYSLLADLGLRSGFGDDNLRIVGIKAFMDGAIGGRTCLLDDPSGTQVHGIQATSTADMTDLIRRAQRDGIRVGVHANGDKAIRIVLAAIEKAQSETPRPGLRHRIEHCSIVDADILTRMAATGTIAVPFGSYAHYHGGKLLDWYGDKRANSLFAHRSFLDSGVGVAGSSDYPCGPYEPLLGMHSMVNRRGFDGAAIGLDQRITPAEALAMYTTGAAVATGESDHKGRLLPGYLADFVALSADPLTTDPAGLASIGVEATYVGGIRRH